MEMIESWKMRRCLITELLLLPPNWVNATLRQPKRNIIENGCAIKGTVNRGVSRGEWLRGHTNLKLAVPSCRIAFKDRLRGGKCHVYNYTTSMYRLDLVKVNKQYHNLSPTWTWSEKLSSPMTKGIAVVTWRENKLLLFWLWNICINIGEFIHSQKITPTSIALGDDVVTCNVWGVVPK